MYVCDIWRCFYGSPRELVLHGELRCVWPDSSQLKPFTNAFPACWVHPFPLKRFWQRISAGQKLKSPKSSWPRKLVKTFFIFTLKINTGTSKKDLQQVGPNGEHWRGLWNSQWWKVIVGRLKEPPEEAGGENRLLRGTSAFLWLSLRAGLQTGFYLS